MASGLPDYFMGVDVAFQALAEMVVRPKFGAAQAANSSGVMTASTKQTLVSVAGKGMIYGGTIGILSAGVQRSDIPILSIEGIELSIATLLNLNKYRMSKESCSPMYLMKYDDVGFQYSVAISPGLTFETSFKVLYDEREGSTPTVFCRVLYAVI